MHRRAQVGGPPAPTRHWSMQMQTRSQPDPTNHVIAGGPVQPLALPSHGLPGRVPDRPRPVYVSTIRMFFLTCLTIRFATETVPIWFPKDSIRVCSIA